MVEVCFFGRLADIAGKHQHVEITSDIQTLEDLLQLLGAQNQVLKEAFDQPGNFLAIDDVMASKNDKIINARMISIGAPVSGG